MRKYFTIFGLIFLVGCGVVFYKNYIDYDVKPTEKPNNDTIFIDTTITDTLAK